MKNDISPINVIVLSDFEKESDCMIAACLDILETCKSRIDNESVLRMVAQEIREITLREILTKEIQMKAAILEQTKSW
ncbi:hypothetical protein PC41400_14520 [Paenibacillus chitinolyticus]|uniref:Uncharacterized protein n=1 Tax=Paenibacillus chitinolyticus TaxID=79263 RepID=A0A410WX21_9BACL|nr:hypothetical protein [Paenibacillus chitinolyticus]MCY9593998.1 hypothetical protein [Paenibacillus chitinolyticus]MCY9598543.1 hypothetical protein [Paenibacillus chitinolyticus]QAV18827.1 hypothetical protein PC41400_14520 [Paenibacillus chitinolyticus]